MRKKMPRMQKLIKISDETYQRLMKKGAKGDTFDEIIIRLLNRK